MESLLQDLRVAVRSLLKTPSFTLIATACLSLGIATNTTLFSVFDAIVIRPLPFEHPDRLVSLLEADPKNQVRSGTSYLNYRDWNEQSQSFAQMGAQVGRQIAITEGDEPERLSAQLITASLFPMLGIRVQIGRLFRDDDDQLGAAGAVLLSDGIWRRRYGADPSVLGRVISIDNEAYTVVGVMPPKFRYPDRSDAWLPIGPALGRSPRTSRAVRVVARMKNDVTIAQASQEIAGIAGRVDRANGIDSGNLVGRAFDFESQFVDSGVRTIVEAMYGAVTFVLLIACANLANLLLTRAAGRQREIAVRSAIGAGRGRIIRQLITEAVVLGAIAGVVAVPLSWFGLKLIDRGIPPEDPVPYWMVWSLDRSTLIYTGVIAIAAGVLFGLAPALQALRGDVFASLKDRGRGATVTKSRLRGALVVLEVALALVLLVGAMLFTRSFASLQGRQAGFDTAPLLTARFFLPGKQYDSSVARVQRVHDMVRRVEQIPGVDAATISPLLPFEGAPKDGNVIVDGAPVEKGKEPAFQWAGVAGRWFDAIGNTVSSGRTFTSAEADDSAPAAVINQTMARQLWPKGNALGSRFKAVSDDPQPWLTVIGVVPDIQVNSLDNTDPIGPMAYLPYQFTADRSNVLIVRVHGAPIGFASAVRSAVRAADPTIPMYAIETMDKVRQLSYWQYGLFGWMFGIFGMIALFLAAIGVYGVISYGVSQRTHEIGVRVALGAQRGDVMRLVVVQGMTLAGIGIAVGILGAFGVTRVVSSFLYGVSATDPVSFVGVALFLALVALVASLLPARRATAVDPIVALRAE